MRGATKSFFQDLRHIPASLPSKFCNDPLHPERPITPTNSKTFELYSLCVKNHFDLLTLSIKSSLYLALTRWVYSKSKRFMSSFLEQSIINVSYKLLGIGFNFYQWYENDAACWKTCEIFPRGTRTDRAFRDKGNGLRGMMVGMILKRSRFSLRVGILVF